MSPILLQFAGSLFAILFVAWLVNKLGLGQEARFQNEAEARAAAEEAVGGFTPEQISLDIEGRGALLRDASGRVLLLRAHGTHFAGRILTSQATARFDGEVLVVDTGEQFYGAARLLLADSQVWVQQINAIDKP